jgi:DnaD/phage-associated family protein
MTTIRVKKDARYFAASNEPFNDKRLSWEARGLMGYLLSKPDSWEVRSADLEEQGPAGSRKIKRMLAELRLHGYMNRIRTKLPDGKFEWTTEVYESPAQNPNPSKKVIKKTSDTKRTSAIPTSAEPHHILSTEQEEAAVLSKVATAYQSEIGLITSMTADDIQDAVKTYPLQWILDAIHEAAQNNKRNWKYCLAILKRWHAQGNQESALKPKETPAPDTTPRPEYQPIPEDPNRCKYVPRPSHIRPHIKQAAQTGD